MIVNVYSAGHDYGNYALIMLNDQEVGFGFENYGCGLNVAVIDEVTGQTISCTTFDTCIDASSVTAFAELVENLPQGRIVAIAAKDDATLSLNDRAKKACESLGSFLLYFLPFRGSWAMIGQKGATVGTAVESVSGDSPVECSRSFNLPSLLESSTGQWQQKQKLQPPDLQRQYIFGSSVAISEEVAIIGARLADANSDKYAGSIYSFQLENGQWIQKQKLQPGDLQRGSCFGNSVAISNNIAIVGAYFAGAEGGQYAGSAYIFQFENGYWIEKQKLQPSDLHHGDNFGYAVGISGNVVIIGARLANSHSDQYVGSAYIFQLENNQWVQKQKLQPADLQRGDNFGTAVAISNDVAIVGARFANAEGGQYAGSAYIFQLENDQWVQKQKLQPADLKQGDNFGNSVAIKGDIAIIGADGVDAEGRVDTGTAYIFQFENGYWIEKQKLQPTDLQRGYGFGTSVSISGDVVIVGAYGVDLEGHPDAGSTYIFQQENGQWMQKQKLQPPELQRSDSFGYAVATNGKFAVVGAHNADAQGNPYAGSAYIFEAGVN